MADSLPNLIFIILSSILHSRIYSQIQKNMPEYNQSWTPMNARANDGGAYPYDMRDGYYQFHPQYPPNVGGQPLLLNHQTMQDSSSPAICYLEQRVQFVEERFEQYVNGLILASILLTDLQARTCARKHERKAQGHRRHHKHHHERECGTLLPAERSSQ